ncbi:MAG TPA: alpha-ketoglutarate-dependent dioxygenase AlkB [Acidimicrobiales bacterium]|nr:alpha-ketoglutarate-dependent dioxygenase AlkB [Acidimicrobiales bacterium]
MLPPMHLDPQLAFQPSLLDDGQSTGIDMDAAFSHLSRIQLDSTSWVDHQPGWVHGSDRLFADLVAGAEWNQRSRHMYGRVVAEPRLTSWWRSSSGRPLEPAVLERMRRLLSERYGVELDSMGLNLYRDGQDSVAWHGDRIAKHVAEPLVAIVSVGEPRTFLLRPAPGNDDVPAGGRRSLSFDLGRGDLLVTGGACQRRWQHTVPKVAQAGPRISITFRHGLDPRAYPDSSESGGSGPDPA